MIPKITPKKKSEEKIIIIVIGHVLNGWSVSVSVFFFFFFLFLLWSHQIYFSFPLINTHTQNNGTPFRICLDMAYTVFKCGFVTAATHIRFIFPICHQLCQILLLQNSDLTCRNSIRKCGERFDWLMSQYIDIHTHIWEWARLRSRSQHL